MLPLDRGSGGKVLLAWASDAARFDVGGRELAAVRKRGWAASVGEREAGVASVSAPVFDGSGSVVARGQRERPDRPSRASIPGAGWGRP